MREFLDNDFAPFVESRFASKPKTLEYYRIGLKNLREFEPLANSVLDAITGDKIAAFIAKRRQVAAQLDMRQTDATSEWVFPAPTATGHIEKSTMKKQHKKALAAAKVEPFTLYTFRHMCLTRWAAFVDPHSRLSRRPQRLLNHAPLRPSTSRHHQSRHRESKGWA